jgi:hypothetical protein
LKYTALPNQPLKPNPTIQKPLSIAQRRESGHDT